MVARPPVGQGDPLDTARIMQGEESYIYRTNDLQRIELRLRDF